MTVPHIRRKLFPRTAVIIGLLIALHSLTVQARPQFETGLLVSLDQRTTEWLDLGVGYLGEHDKDQTLAGLEFGISNTWGTHISYGLRARWLSAGDEASHVDRVFGNATEYEEREHSKQGDTWALQAHVGRQFGKVKAYIGLGYALTDTEYRITGYFADDVVFARGDSQRGGWLYVLGLELPIAEKIALFAEYSRTDFKRDTEQLRCTPTYPDCGSLVPEFIPVEINQEHETWSAGLRYRF